MANVKNSINVPIDFDHMRFWKKVKMTKECWNWIGAKGGKPCVYGKFNIHKKTYAAHRVAYTIVKGSINNLYVRHLCHNSLCVNPDHLELGTAKDNMKDRDMAGRGWLPDKPPDTKLNEFQVKNIKSKIQGIRGELTALAKEYNVSISTISAIKHKRNWEWL